MRRALTYEDSVRWGRCMAETVKIASTVCPASAMEAYGEIVTACMYVQPSDPHPALQNGMITCIALC